jgi:hypothetical protein
VSARDDVLAALTRDGITLPARWRVIITDSESPTGVAPVCTAANSLHMIDDYPGGPKYDEDGVYDCCPWPQFDTYSETTAAYLVELLNADATAPKDLEAHRTEVLAEVTTWLIKKAREFHASRRKQEREQGDTCAVLASKIARGAIRPDNQRMLPNAGFFEVDHTYQFTDTSPTLHVTTWTFKVDSISTPPGGGRPVAFGWRRENNEPWEPDSCDDLDGWTDVTEAGDR